MNWYDKSLAHDLESDRDDMQRRLKSLIQFRSKVGKGEGVSMPVSMEEINDKIFDLQIKLRAIEQQIWSNVRPHKKERLQRV